MGKKRVIAKTEEELLKETEEREAAQRKAARLGQKAKTKKIEEGRVFIQSTYNNTIVTITDTQGNVLAWASSGSVGFKGPKKATPFAASRVVEAVMEKVRKIGFKQASVFVKGIGSGREAAIRALISQGLEINLIKDVTPIPHNGCRPPKVRRV
jgi:small subunit ribosomal protein S11